MEILRINMVNAMADITKTAMFFSMMTDKKLLVSDRDVRIRNTFPMMSEVKAMALTSPSEWPS